MATGESCSISNAILSNQRSALAIALVEAASVQFHESMSRDSNQGECKRFRYLHYILNHHSVTRLGIRASRAVEWGSFAIRRIGNHTSRCQEHTFLCYQRLDFLQPGEKSVFQVNRLGQESWFGHSLLFVQLTPTLCALYGRLIRTPCYP